MPYQVTFTKPLNSKLGSLQDKGHCAPQCFKCDMPPIAASKMWPWCVPAKDHQDPSSLFAGTEPVLQLQHHRMVGSVRRSCQTVDGYVSYWRTATQLLFILTVVSVFLFMLHYFVFLFFSYRRDFTPAIQFRCAICECRVSFSHQNINCVCAKEAEMLNTLQARSLLFAKHHLRLKDVDCLITVKARVQCSMSSDLNMTLRYSSRGVVIKYFFLFKHLLLICRKGGF